MAVAVKRQNSKSNGLCPPEDVTGAVPNGCNETDRPRRNSKQHGRLKRVVYGELIVLG